MTKTNARLAFRLLGLADAPLAPRAMADRLRVTLFPPHEHTPEVGAFAERLTDALARAGAEIIPFEDSLDARGKVREGIVVIEQGEAADGRMAMRRVSSLYQNPLVAIYDQPPPVGPNAGLQETLDAIVGLLTWNLTHVPIFIHEGRWTICTMNGAVIPCGVADDLDGDVLQALVPKLAAQVKPPDPTLITVREGALDISTLGAAVEDFIAGARAWDETGLMLAHTSLAALRYRNRFARLIAATYLDNRTGMSYGFLARQLPVRVDAAQPLAAAPEAVRALNWERDPVKYANGEWMACVRVNGKDWLVQLPEISVLCTRSGCEKTRIVPETDLVRLTLTRDGILFDTPHGADATHTRPSYDTLAILAHAAGNAIAASVLLAQNASDPFAAALAADGLALAHWHGYPERSATPEGFALHGETNPPVSCSTPQSAAFALVGKLDALGRHMASGEAYLGDVHVEPHHGTNLTGRMSLAEAARWAEAQQAVEA